MTYYAMYDLTIFVCIYFFCFFKQKTAYEMRISDWSSDVCSSDLEEALAECRRVNIRLQQLSDKYHSERKYQRDAFIHNLMGIIYQIGRASCRERVCSTCRSRWSPYHKKKKRESCKSTQLR